MAQTTSRQRFFLRNMVETCRRIQDFTAGMTREQFEQDRMTFDATSHNLVVLGEQAKRAPQVLGEQAPGIDWKEAADLADNLMTLPRNIDVDRVWMFIVGVVPNIRQEAERLLSTIETEH